MKIRTFVLLACYLSSLVFTANIPIVLADVPPDQVLLEAKIQEASSGTLDELGVDASTAGTSSADTPSTVTMDKDGNYVLPSGEKLSFEGFINRYPVWSGVVIGPPPAASQGIGDYYYGLSGLNYYRGDLRGFRFSGDYDSFGDSYKNPTADPRSERWGRNHYPFGPDIRFQA